MFIEISNTSKPFLFEYKAAVGGGISVIKGSKKKSLSGTAVVNSSSRKKCKGGLLKEPVKIVGVSAGAASSNLVRHESGNITKLESVDIGEKYLIEETSFQLESKRESGGNDIEATPKGPKRIVTKRVLGKPLSTIDFGRKSNDDDDVLDNSILLLPPLLLKPSIQISVCKSFALNIDLVAVSGKSSQKKLHFVRKLFSSVNGFGGAFTPSKFGGIIQATFTSEEVMITVANLANDHSVMVNTNLKCPVNNCTNRAIVLKKIPVGTSLETVRTTVAEFGIIKSIKMQLTDFLASKWSILIEKDMVRVARADIDKQLWDARNNFRTLLYILPMGTTAHDLWDFIGSIGGKTCFINHNPVSYSHIRCATVCFSSEVELVNAMATTPVIKDLNFGHTALSCRSVKNAGIAEGRKAPLLAQDQSRLAKIYAKKSASISRLLAFDSKTWALVVGAFSIPSLSGSKAHFGSIIDGKPTPPVAKNLEKKLVSIEDGLVSLAGQIDKLTKKLELLMLVVPQPGHKCWLPVIIPLQNSESNVTVEIDLSMANGHESAMFVDSSTSPYVVRLENMLKGLSKSVLSLSACFDSLIINKFNGVWVFTTGLDSGYLGAGVVVVMNSSLAKHVCKVFEVLGQLMSIKLLFKNKLSVSILGIYAGASSAVWFSQTDKINSIIAKAVNESSFVILSSDFNEDGSCKCASFKKCLDLGLINSLVRSLAVKMPTWENSRSVKRTIDYMFVSPNLVNVMIRRNVSGVSEHSDTDHQAVLVSLGLGELLDMQLNSFRKQANRNRWKFDFKGADKGKWINFKYATLANATIFSNEFTIFVGFSDLDAIWDVVHKIIVLLASEVFKKKWFKEFNDIFTKESSRFHKLELLVSKIIKAFRCQGFGCLGSGVESNHVHSALFGAKKSYRVSKLVKSQSTKDANIRSVIDKRMESFEVDKDHTIKSVLECLFRKIVLDHLVVDDDLILEPKQVKSKLLEYVFDKAFSKVMCSIEYDEFLGVVSDLPDGKAAGLLGISNELWKHCDRSVLDMLLVLLNSCLSSESVLMIPKFYEWKNVLINTCLIALIEMAHKILSKILSNRISLACSTFNVLRGANFSVLKGTTTQFPIFAIGSVVKNALEKNRELWLVLQDMRKAYDSVGWEHLKKSLVRIKMCSKFIRFFGGIHRNRTNQVMTDFGLTSGYCVHNGLDQGEVFSPLLWHIFYDPFLCEVKRQESICGYRLISHFVSKNSCSKPQAGFSFFFATGAFVDDTIWVGSSQMATQHILNVASEFFRVNDISINNNKMVAIPINSRGLSKPSLVKAHSDIRFFTNLVLRKVVSDKQFLYLVLAVLHPIVSYRTQFSFIPVGVYNKWDALIHKGLKLKSGLPLDFPNDVIYHPSFYGLKSFFQVQSESKIASLVSFANSGGILGYLFSYRSHDLQVLCWRPVHPLSSPVRIYVSASNNFLAGMICVLLDCNVFLGGSLVSSFRSYGGVPMSELLGESRFLRFLPSLRWYSIAFVDQLHDRHGAVYDWYTFKWWKRLDPHGPVPEWFKHSVLFLNSVRSFHVQSLVLGDGGLSNILESDELCLASSLLVYTDGSLSNHGTVGCRAGTAVFFEDIGLDLGVSVLGLMSSTLAELQAVALALECVFSSSSVCLFSDSQSALDACRSELGLVYSDYRNQYWVKRRHIVNVICSKKLRVSFHKVKDHSGVLRNKRADAIAGATSLSNWYLPSHLSKHFLSADGSIVSGNSRHFVGSGSGVLVSSLSSEVDWPHSLLVWHSNLHMAAGFTNRSLSSMRTYFMKSLHHRLPVAVRKRLYNRHYLSVLCLYCDKVEVSDHVFSYKVDESVRSQLLDSHVGSWKALSGFSYSSSGILQLLSFSISDSSVSMAFFKGFVFNKWFCETVSIFHNPKIAVLKIVKFVHSLGLAFREDHRAYMEKNGLILLDGSAIISVVRLLGITNALGVYFGFHKSCLFFSGIGESVSVHIAA
ncbi:hypothetical protein G9A89_021453 [Geosiphon pyriformis]|nr:hypothetical protein G9A89_021453 [Geosiphon pyriformis]